MKAEKTILHLGFTLLLFLPAGSSMGSPQDSGLDRATPVDRLRLREGFRAELLYSVPRNTQGSWVSLTVDPKGRLIASDQYGKLYRIAVPSPGRPASDTRVELLPVEMGMAQGLLYAFDSLYVMVNGKGFQGAGLYRLRDTDGDDQFDEVRLLRRLNDGREHGPHGIVLSPDGKSLYVVAGNHTDPPKPLEASRVPRVWQEDQLLPRMPDAIGHARNRFAPGGWICRVDPDGTRWELVSIGYRNAYDIAFHRDGELFTFDSDMEWDMNTPWYRPTRICHAVSGSEFGWRNGTGKWPVHYPDSLPAAVDIGPGSPTGVAFGYGAKFPAKYQNAFYAADWSYGKLYAVHLRPDGASYSGTAEEFISAQPLPLTDLLIHPSDGAMYFTIGGRKTQSGLYRVTYTGPESTAPARRDAAGAEWRKIRRSLEAYHGRRDERAVDAAWKHLVHADRHIRYAARTALEHQDPSLWQDRALQESDPDAALAALLALARVGDKAVRPRLIRSLNRLEWATLDLTQSLELLRVLGLAYARMGGPEGEEARAARRRFEPHYPAADPLLNAELCRLLAYLQAPSAARKTLDLMDSALTQEEQLHFALSLRVVRTGWTTELRRRYLDWFARAAGYRGGHSFSKFIEKIRNEALQTFTAEEKKTLATVIERKPNVTASPKAPPRPFVRKWRVADLLPEFQQGLRGRDFENGRKMFAAAGCFACHRVRLEGGAFGPDLTGTGGRFGPRDLLESVIEPSKVISDQYEAVKIALKDGTVIAGRIINMSGDGLRVNTDMRDPDKIAIVRRQDVRAMAPSDTSMMPTNLLDTFKKGEILDLMAYLISGADPSHEAFK